MRRESLPQDEWKSTKDFSSVTTNILTLLFVGLIISCLGLVRNIRNYYPAAVATTIGAENSRLRADKAQSQTLALVAATVEERLQSRIKGSSNCERARTELSAELKRDSEGGIVPAARKVISAPVLGSKGETVTVTFAKESGSSEALEKLARVGCNWTIPPATSNSFDDIQEWLREESSKEKERIQRLAAVVSNKALRQNPFEYVESLRVDEEQFWLAEFLQSEITNAFNPLIEKERNARQRYVINRVLPENTPFDLLGIQLSVGGYWAWIVWLFFFAFGMLSLWLGRRRLLRQAQTIWQSHVSSQTSSEIVFGSLPLWARPLSRSEPWTQMLRPLREDFASEPLSALCTLLLIICLIVGMTVVLPMGLLSNWLLSAGTFPLERFFHGGILSALAGLVIALTVTWFRSPNHPRRSKAPISDQPRIQVFGRRTLLITAVSALGVAAVSFSGIWPVGFGKWFLSPRSRRKRDIVRARSPRIRRARRDIPALSTGFYLDTKGTIFFVPAGGKSRSLAGRTKSELHEWNGPFDEENLRKTHPSARMPFVYLGVQKLLRGLTHRPAGQDHYNERVAEKAALNRMPATKQKFRQAFELVLTAIRRGSTHRKTNAQLFSLLRAIAANCQDPGMIKEVSLLVESELRLRDYQQQMQTRLRQTQTVALRLKESLEARSGQAQPTVGVNQVNARNSKRRRKPLRKKLQDIVVHAKRLSLDLTPNNLSNIQSALGSYQMGMQALVSPEQIPQGLSEVETVPRRQSDQETLAILRRIFQKASRDEDFSVELALVPSTVGQQTRNMLESFLGESRRTDSQANQIHVIRISKGKRSPRKRILRRWAGWDLLG